MQQAGSGLKLCTVVTFMSLDFEWMHFGCKCSPSLEKIEVRPSVLIELRL